MKFSKKLLIISLAFTIILSGLTFLKVNAQDETISTQQIEQIKSECVLTKNTLNQLHASDALLRVNRGQIYEAMQTKLMDGFNGRIANNNLDNTKLTAVTDSYESALDTFRSDYISYEEQLSSAIDIDCSKQPVAFYDAVASARTKRTKVHEDVLKLNEYIDQYQAAVEQFEKDYQVVADGSNK